MTALYMTLTFPLCILRDVHAEGGPRITCVHTCREDAGHPSVLGRLALNPSKVNGKISVLLDIATKSEWLLGNVWMQPLTTEK